MSRLKRPDSKQERPTQVGFGKDIDAAICRAFGGGMYGWHHDPNTHFAPLDRKQFETVELAIRDVLDRYRDRKDMKPTMKCLCQDATWLRAVRAEQRRRSREQARARRILAHANGDFSDDD